MTMRYRVNLLGFSAFERNALGSYFRLAPHRQPGYEQVRSHELADFLVVDADHGESVDLVLQQQRSADAVFIGTHAPPGAIWMMRPIDPLHVLRELDAMALQRDGHIGDTEAAPLRPLGDRPARRSGDTPSGFVALGALRLARLPVAQPVTASVREGRAPRALLVDDSEVALRYLELRLKRCGVQTEVARTSSRALQLLERGDFRFVFLDVELGEDSDLDGLALCHQVKHQGRSAAPGRAPVVALVSAHHGEVDRVRGALAGADAYLAKPLNDDRLEQLLALHGVRLPGAASALPS